MKLTKQQRVKLRNKYGGRCAYCGCELTTRFHADHIIPIRRNADGTCENPKADNFENLNPSCPSCNKMKHTLSIEGFRKMIENFVKSLNRDSNQYKFAKKYKLVEEIEREVRFYFEDEIIF